MTRAICLTCGERYEYAGGLCVECAMPAITYASRIVGIPTHTCFFCEGRGSGKEGTLTLANRKAHWMCFVMFSSAQQREAQERARSAQIKDVAP